MRPADIPQRYEGFTDPLCLRFSWPRVDPPTLADVAAAAADDRSLLLGICNPADPAILWGNISLYDVDHHNRRAAIGYWLARPARGHGNATRALRLLSAWAFDHLHLARLELTCAPDNLASQRVAERAGFMREGLLRSHMTFKNTRRDTVVYGLLPTDPR